MYLSPLDGGQSVSQMLELKRKFCNTLEGCTPVILVGVLSLPAIFPSSSQGISGKSLLAQICIATWIPERLSDYHADKYSGREVGNRGLHAILHYEKLYD